MVSELIFLILGLSTFRRWGGFIFLVMSSKCRFWSAIIMFFIYLKSGDIHSHSIWLNLRDLLWFNCKTRKRRQCEESRSPFLQQWLGVRQVRHCGEWGDIVSKGFSQAEVKKDSNENQQWPLRQRPEAQNTVLSSDFKKKCYDQHNLWP